VEFSLLEVMLRAAGQVVPREDLALQVLGRKLSPYDRSIDVHVSSLRKKLGHQVGDTERIRTVRGVGYLYSLPSSPDPKGTEP
jgi:two-component system response regulator CpxR